MTLSVILPAVVLSAQTMDQEDFIAKKSNIPKAIDFSRMFQEGTGTREDFELLKQRKETQLRELMTRPVAIEKTVDPKEYIVGPGDGFSFNIWGALEMQHPLYVNPEGKILIPSVGEISVAGRTLEEVQTEFINKSKVYYANSHVTLTLEAMRFFKVHVVGEVQYPGTYVAQATSRISELIASAGGVTEIARKNHVELRKTDGRTSLFDLDAFEQTGGLGDNSFVNGGDVVCVPALSREDSLVTVEGSFETNGVFHVRSGESVQELLMRIRAVRRNTDLGRIVIVRKVQDGRTKKPSMKTIVPFHPDSIGTRIALRNGDKIVLPSDFVYVKGAVQSPGAYPFMLNMRARDYAGMAGGDYRSTGINGIKVYHVASEKSGKGANEIVEPGDVVNIGQSMDERLKNYFSLFSVLTSLLLAAKAAGFFSNQ